MTTEKAISYWNRRLELSEAVKGAAEEENIPVSESHTEYIEALKAAITALEVVGKCNEWLARCEADCRR